MTTPKLQMPELVVGQAGKELTHNQALAILDQLAQAVVVDKDLTAPPGSPVNGSMYIVAASATGAWAGQSGKLAYWLTTVAAWTFITPADGWFAWVTDEAVRYERKAGAWVVVSTGATCENILINGCFRVNQREVSGTVTLAAGAYGHDRWKAGASGCTYTFATTANVTTITITAGSLQQVIEGINLQSGTHVLSWSGTSQGRIGAGAYGASGITGSAVGGTNLTIEFNTGTLAFAQFEPGSTASTHSLRIYGEELALCQRYYWRGLGGFALNFNSFSSGAFFSWPVSFPVTMRVTPTLSSSIAGITLFNASGFLWDYPSVSAGRIILSSTATATNCYFILGSSDYLAASSEL